MADRRAAYQYLPSEVLATQRRADEAKAWADAQRRDLAATWAQLHEQDALDTLSPLLQEAQTAQEPPGVGGGLETGSFGSPSMAGVYAPPEAPIAAAGEESLVGAPAPAELAPDPVQAALDLLGQGAPEPMATGEADRPASEFEAPSQFPPAAPIEDGGAVGRRWDDGGAIGGTYGEAYTPNLPGPLGWLQGQMAAGITSTARQTEALREHANLMADTIARGEPITEEDRARGGELVEPFATALTGEPIANVAGRAASAAGSGLGGAARRFFHGTGSAFDRPEPGRFDPAGLMGPGYYLSSDSRVASQYAEDALSRFGDRGSGPNVRAVDVPADLHLFDLSRPADPTALEPLFAGIEDAGIGRRIRDVIDRVRRDPAGLTNHDVWLALRDDFSPEGANKTLRHFYDGIEHTGGHTRPLLDADERAITHDVTVIFPDALPKIRNAISGTQGGQIDPALAVRLGAGAAAGLEPQTDDEGQITGVGYDPLRGIGGALGLGAAGSPTGRRVLRDVGAAAKRRGLVPGLSIEEVGAEAGTARRAAGEVERLRLDKVPEAVRDVIQEAGENAGFWKTQRRGVIPDAEAERMADEIGLSVDQAIAGGKAGKAYNTETTRAIRNAVVAQALKVKEIAIEIAADPTAASPRLIAEQLAEGMKLSDLTRVAEGAKSEAGRTLRAYQAFARDYAADPTSAVQRIFRATGLTPEQATEAVTQFTRLQQAGADPFQLANFWAKVERPPVTGGDWFRALRYNAMLSGPRTALVNIVGNATEVPWRLVRDAGASALTGDLRPLRPEIEGIGAGAVKGLQAFGEILAHGLTAEQAIAGDLPRSLSSRLDNPLAKGAALTLESVGRVLGGTDAFFHQLNYGLAKGREAGIKASKEGLKGQAWLDRVDELVADATPSVGALAVADRATYKGPMGYVGEKVLAPLQQWSPLGVPVGNIVMPFLRTVYHITERGIDRSPVGAVRTGVEVLRGEYGPLTRANLGQQLRATEGPAKGVAPLGERVGDAVMGSAAFGVAGLIAANGDLSGAGPEDPEKRKMMQAEGWQPFSVRIGDRWLSYANWGPIAVPLSMAAGMVESQRYKKADAGVGEQLYDTAQRGAQLLTEQAYLQGIGAIYKAWSGKGTTYGEAWLENVLSSLVPFGAAINTYAQSTDPLVRQPERGDVVGALEARMPGMRESLPARQDVLGRDVENPQQGLGALVPLRTTRDQPSSVIAALREANVDIGEPPKTVSAGDLTGVPITTAEQRAYRRVMGERLSGYVEKYLASDKARTDSPTRRAATLQVYLDNARQAAAAQVLKGMGRDQIRDRLKRAKPAA